MAECSHASCRQRATVILEKDQRPYCRACGLGKAVWRPRCDVHPISPEAPVLPEDLARTHGIGRCPACESVIRWAVLNGDMEDLVMLDWGVLKRPAMVRDLAYNPVTYGAVIVGDGMVQRVRDWQRAGRVHIYRDHATVCAAVAAVTGQAHPSA